MASQSNPFEALLQKRMELLMKIAEANANHLRLQQKKSGNDFLLMMEPNGDQSKTPQDDTDAALDVNLIRLESLDQRMARIDQEIANAAGKEK